MKVQLTGLEIASVLGNVATAVPTANNTLQAIANVIVRSPPPSPPGEPPPSPPGAAPPSAPGGRPPPATLEEIFTWLEDMTLPPEVLQRAQPLFANGGYIVGEALAEVEHENTPRRYTVVIGANNVRLALVMLPAELFRFRMAWGSFRNILEVIDGEVRLLVLKGTAPAAFDAFIDLNSGKLSKSWKTIPWDWVQSFLDEQEKRIDTTFRVQIRPQQLGDLTAEDREKIVQLLTLRASSAPTPKQALRDHVIAAGWPGAFMDTFSWSNAPRTAAQDLVDLAIEKKRFAPNEARPGDTYLGALLEVALPYFGGDDSQSLAQLIVRYSLVAKKH